MMTNTPLSQRLWEKYAIVLVFFIPAMWLFVGLGERSQEKAYHAVLTQLNGLSSAFVVELNGRRVDDPSRIIGDLRRVRRFQGEHAPGLRPKWYRIEVTEKQRTLRLLLAQPENPADKYWVFLPEPDSSGVSSRSPKTRIGGFIDAELAAFLTPYNRE